MDNESNTNEYSSIWFDKFLSLSSEKRGIKDIYVGIYKNLLKREIVRNWSLNGRRKNAIRNTGFRWQIYTTRWS